MSEYSEVPVHSEEAIGVEREPFTVRRIEIDNGEDEKLQVRHPELIGIDEERELRPDEKVTVVASEQNEPQEIAFEQYLELIGADPEYYHVVRSQESGSNGDILLDLHRRVLRHRKEQSHRLHERYAQEEARRDNLQAETRAHSIVFQKVFNDLGIEGLSAQEAERQVDYLSGVDEYLTVGDKTIAIQRSFGDKRPESEEDTWRTIPEHPEFGKIPRVYINEGFEDYGLDSEGKGTNYAEQLYRLRRERALKAHKPAKEMRLPPLYTVLDDDREEGMRKQARTALKTLIGIRREIDAYTQQSTEEEVEALKQTRNALSKAIDEVRESFPKAEEKEEEPAA